MTQGKQCSVQLLSDRVAFLSSTSTYSRREGNRGRASSHSRGASWPSFSLSAHLSSFLFGVSRWKDSRREGMTHFEEEVQAAGFESLPELAKS